ncbi:MAG: 4-phosphoerythronate dehydrogenase [Bacteroidota bacterium]
MHIPCTKRFRHAGIHGGVFPIAQPPPPVTAPLHTRPLRLLADANIPFLHEAFDRYGTVEVRPGAAILPGTLAETDILLVRSVTPVNEALLAGTPVRFVGTATAGTDHVDTDWLAAQGITFASAPGSNAQSVVEYVLAALTWLGSWAFASKTIGVVGCGQVGGRLLERLPYLGFRVLACDPPLAEAAEAVGEPHDFVSLDRILDEADVVTLHTPLTRAGRYPTYHLIGKRELKRMTNRKRDRRTWRRPQTLLINAARGSVVDNDALRETLQRNPANDPQLLAVLDVWENEPTPDPDLIPLVSIGTPHIAGYAYDGKVAGTSMLVDALNAWLRSHVSEADRIPEDIPERWDAEEVLLKEKPPVIHKLGHANPDLGTDDAAAQLLVHRAYSISNDDARFRRLLDLPSSEYAAYFRELRKTYPQRRHFDRFTVGEPAVGRFDPQVLVNGLGFSAEQQ